MSNEFDAFDDDLIAAWAADAMARKRAHDVFGPNTEPLDKEDELVLAESRRRWALKQSSRPDCQADQDVERDSDREAER
jgi:hypothetical protein